MRKEWKVLIACLAVLLGASLTIKDVLAQNKTVALFSPGVEENKFWKNVIEVSRDAANDLNFELEVYYANDDPELLTQKLEEVTEAAIKPDAVLVPNMSGYGEMYLKIAEQNDVLLLSYNMPMNRNEVGEPREQYGNWIGEIRSNDKQAGYLLGKNLINSAIETQELASGEEVLVYAINGRSTDTISQERIKGLKRAVDEIPQARIVRIDNTDWSSNEAEEAMSNAINDFPEISVVWAASDKMALAISEMLQNSGRKINQDIFVGGIDWLNRALDAVSESELTASAGGHVIGAGWALVMLFDYFNGKDFASESTILNTQMGIVNQGNVEEFTDKLGPGKWNRINFRLYSKIYNDRINSYRFTLETFMVQLR